ncbi:hypothetical protein EIK80_03610 [Caulobacter sp. 602-1]|nr:hypothetical protein EIK80_03610 [Caulobacter sp. 602-1]
MSAASHFQGDKTMSDLIDRYLAAVAALLPKAQRQDIAAELRDLIMNRVEETEGRLGRRLDKRETEDLLREIGHPIAVAGRYGPRQSLIGPELYPFWEFAVKVMLVIAAMATFIPGGVLLVIGDADAHRIGGLFGDFVSLAFSLVGVATLVGAAIERGWIKVDEFAKWKVADLPHIPRGRPLFAKSRFDAVFELAALALFVGWWTGAMKFPIGAMFDAGRGDLKVILAPVLTTFYWPILVLALLQMVSAAITVIRPGAVRARAAAEIVCALGGVALVAVLWPAQPLIVFQAPEGAYAALGNLRRSVDLSIQVILVVMAAISLTTLAVNAWRLARGR